MEILDLKFRIFVEICLNIEIELFFLQQVCIFISIDFFLFGFNYFVNEFLGMIFLEVEFQVEMVVFELVVYGDIVVIEIYIIVDQCV